MRSSKPILLVEDNREDAMTVGPALKDLKVTNRLIHVAGFENAKNYFQLADLA